MKQVQQTYYRILVMDAIFLYFSVFPVHNALQKNKNKRDIHYDGFLFMHIKSQYLIIIAVKTLKTLTFYYLALTILVLLCYNCGEFKAPIFIYKELKYD